MSRRTRATLLVAGGLVLGLACGDGMEMVGDAMVDAGRRLSDGGDAMVPDAAAQPTVLEADCSIEMVQDTEYSTGRRDVRTWYYAEVTDASIRPSELSSAIAIICGLETEGPNPTPCPDGATCSRRDAYPYRDCVSAPVQLEEGRALVQCGYRNVTTAADGTMYVNATYRTSARFVFE